MPVDLHVALAGLVVGIVVGLTGMGGAALLTSIMVLVFRIPPVAAVSSELVASVVMKPAASLVHIRRRTVHWELARLLSCASVPAAFLGVAGLHLFGDPHRIQATVRFACGVAVLLAALGTVANTRLRDGDKGSRPALRRRPTILVGAICGFIVGMTAVGSGSLVIVSLTWVYPRMRASDMVGTDLVQAIPMVASASLAHLLYGDVNLAITLALLAGSIPGAFLGAQVSSRASWRVMRPILAFVLVPSALGLLGASSLQIAVACAATVTGLAVYVGARRTMERRAGRRLASVA